MTRRLIVLTGAGISAPSGLATFRDDKEGFWKKYDSDEVCNAATRTTKAHYDFMNLYRKLVSEASPNRAHSWLAQLERKFGDKELSICLRLFTPTQNFVGIYIFLLNTNLNLSHFV